LKNLAATVRKSRFRVVIASTLPLFGCAQRFHYVDGGSVTPESLLTVSSKNSHAFAASARSTESPPTTELSPIQDHSPPDQKAKQNKMKTFTKENTKLNNIKQDHTT
jgi:hypothetical protein